MVDQYLALTGGVDSGLVEADVLRQWATVGLFGKKIAGYAPVRLGTAVELRQVVAFYGAVYAGVRMPSIAMQQFQDGQPWALTGTSADYDLAGGHAVPVVAYGPTELFVVTWGQIQPVTWDWWQTYAEEAWAVLSSEIVAAGGYVGLDVAQLQADISSL